MTVLMSAGGSRASSQVRLRCPGRSDRRGPTSAGALGNPTVYVVNAIGSPFAQDCLPRKDGTAPLRRSGTAPPWAAPCPLRAALTHGPERFLSATAPRPA